MHFQPQLLCDLSCHESSESEIQGKEGCKKSTEGSSNFFSLPYLPNLKITDWNETFMLWDMTSQKA